jgi:hypothetical protein
MSSVLPILIPIHMLHRLFSAYHVSIAVYWKEYIVACKPRYWLTTSKQTMKHPLLRNRFLTS